MSYSYSSAARELPILDTPHIPEAPAQHPRARLKVVEKTQPKSLAFVNFRNICMFFSIIGCICIMLHSQVKLNEVNGKINQIDAEITQLQSEHVKMQSNLEYTVSRRNVAKQAEQELGLQKIDPSQVVHIHIYEEGSVEVVNAKEPEGISETIETFAARIAQSIEKLFSAA